MVDFLSTLDPELLLAVTALIAVYAAIVSTFNLVVEIWRWRREKKSVFALLQIDPPDDVQIYWDPGSLQLVLFDKHAQTPIPGVELGLTNIGSGVARNITLKIVFDCPNLKELIRRSGVFRNIANVIGDDEVILTAERVKTDEDGPLVAIDKRDATLRYNVEDCEEVRILDPTTSDVQKRQVLVRIPRNVCNAISLFGLSSFAVITKKEVGSVGERIETSYTASVRSIGVTDMKDSWWDYRHPLPRLKVELEYVDDYGRKYRDVLEMDGSFICTPNPVIMKRQKSHGMAVRLRFARPQKIQS